MSEFFVGGKDWHRLNGAAIYGAIHDGKAVGELPVRGAMRGSGGCEHFSACMRVFHAAYMQRRRFSRNSCHGIGIMAVRAMPIGGAVRFGFILFIFNNPAEIILNRLWPVGAKKDDQLFCRKRACKMETWADDSGFIANRDFDACCFSLSGKPDVSKPKNPCAGFDGGDKIIFFSLRVFGHAKFSGRVKYVCA